MSYICEANKFDFFIADSNEKYQSNFGVVKKNSRITFDTSYSEEAFEKLFEPGEEIFLVISHNQRIIILEQEITISILKLYFVV